MRITGLEVVLMACQDSPSPKFRSCMARLTTKSVRKEMNKKIDKQFYGSKICFIYVSFLKKKKKKKKKQHKNLFNL